MRCSEPTAGLLDGLVLRKPEALHQAADGSFETFVGPPSFGCAKPRQPRAQRDPAIVVEQTDFPERVEQLRPGVKPQRSGFLDRDTLARGPAAEDRREVEDCGLAHVAGVPDAPGKRP